MPKREHGSASVILHFARLKPVSSENFGIIIAYLIPGFTAIWGVSYVSPVVRSWIGASSSNSPTLGGFLYITIASLGAGMIVSTVRWMLIDTLHHWTGIKRPDWNFAKLPKNVSAYEMLTEHHYRYYRFHANELIALVWAYALRRWTLGFWSAPIGWVELLVVLLAVVLFLGSRDNLKKYYSRTNQFLRLGRRR